MIERRNAKLEVGGEEKGERRREENWLVEREGEFVFLYAVISYRNALTRTGERRGSAREAKFPAPELPFRPN